MLSLLLLGRRYTMWHYVGVLLIVVAVPVSLVPDFGSLGRVFCGVVLCVVWGVLCGVCCVFLGVVCCVLCVLCCMLCVVCCVLCCVLCVLCWMLCRACCLLLCR